MISSFAAFEKRKMLDYHKKKAIEYNGPAEPVRQFMLSQAPNSTEPHTESD